MNEFAKVFLGNVIVVVSLGAALWLLGRWQAMLDRKPSGQSVAEQWRNGRERDNR